MIANLSVLMIFVWLPKTAPSLVPSAFYPPWDGKMSGNSFIWVTEGGDLGTADWGCLAGRCVSLCLPAARGGRAAGGSG